MLTTGKIAKIIDVTVREIARSDLERLRETRHNVLLPQRLRDSHHRIARLLATGDSNTNIAQRTGYSVQRIATLANAPAMVELVARYREKIDEAFVQSQDEYYTLATNNMLAAERHIADAIAEADEVGELLPIKTALAISRDAADRFGYGKKQTNLNVNLDFASMLEKAIKRSGKTIEPAPQTVASQRRHVEQVQGPQVSVLNTPTRREPTLEAPQPVRRRA